MKIVINIPRIPVVESVIIEAIKRNKGGIFELYKKFFECFSPMFLITRMIPSPNTNKLARIQALLQMYTSS